MPFKSIMAFRKHRAESQTKTPKSTPPAGGRPPEAGKPSADMIARRAYQIWESHGRPSGTSEQDWAQAESELRSASPFRIGRRERR